MGFRVEGLGLKAPNLRLQAGVQRGRGVAYMRAPPPFLEAFSTRKPCKDAPPNEVTFLGVPDFRKLPNGSRLRESGLVVWVWFRILGVGLNRPRGQKYIGLLGLRVEGLGQFRG